MSNAYHMRSGEGNCIWIGGTAIRAVYARYCPKVFYIIHFHILLHLKK